MNKSKCKKSGDHHWVNGYGRDGDDVDGYCRQNPN